MGIIVAVGDTEGAGTTIEDRSPVAGSSLLGSSLEGIVTGSSLSVTVGCEVVLELDTSEEIVLTKGSIHLIGDDGGLRLCQVTVGEDITSQSPCGEVILTVVHYDLHHRSGIVILCRTGLILERVSTTEGVVELTELRVQLGSD